MHSPLNIKLVCHVGVYSFVLKDSLRMASWNRNISEYDICYELYFIRCICCCKNMHGTGNMKFHSLVDIFSLKSSQINS